MAKCTTPYCVEKIVGKKIENKSIFYRAQRKKFSGKATWIPLENCENCVDMVVEFERAFRIYLNQIHSRVEDGKASNEEISTYKLESDSWTIFIDPKMYLAEQKNDKNDKKVVIEVVAYKPQLDVFHVKYEDGDEEYLDRVYVNKYYEQQVIAYYEKKLTYNHELNRKIVQKLVDHPSRHKPSLSSPVIATITNPYFKENALENISLPERESTWSCLEMIQNDEVTQTEAAQKDWLANLNDLGPINSDQAYYAVSAYCDDLLSKYSPQQEINNDESSSLHVSLLDLNIDSLVSSPSPVHDQATYPSPYQDEWLSDYSNSEH